VYTLRPFLPTNCSPVQASDTSSESKTAYTIIPAARVSDAPATAIIAFLVIEAATLGCLPVLERVSDEKEAAIPDPVGVGTPEVNGTLDDPVAEGKADAWVEARVSGSLLVALGFKTL